jgi:hypothetical protein
MAKAAGEAGRDDLDQHRLAHDRDAAGHPVRRRRRPAGVADAGQVINCMSAKQLLKYIAAKRNA